MQIVKMNSELGVEEIIQVVDGEIVVFDDNLGVKNIIQIDKEE